MATYFTGGTIWCSLGTIALSVRVDGGKVVEINGTPQPNDTIVELGDQFLAPAFMDGHAHPLFPARQ